MRITPIDGTPPRRSLYGLLPDTGARLLDLALLDEVTEAAGGPA